MKLNKGKVNTIFLNYLEINNYSKETIVKYIYVLDFFFIWLNNKEKDDLRDQNKDVH